MKLIHYLWILPFISFLSGYFLLAHFYPVDMVQTPSLVGMTLQSAFPLISSHNLNIRLLAFKQEPELPEGTILTQNPAADSLIKPNQAIHLVVSEKPPKVKTPSLLTKSIETIEKELSSADIHNKTYLLHSIRPAKECIGQSPAPGTLLEEKNIITYASSGKNKPILLPKLKGQSVDTATEFLKKNGITYTLTHSTPPFHGHVCTESCIISDQRPLAYSIIPHCSDEPLQIHLQIRHKL